MKKAGAFLAVTALAGGAIWFVLDYRHDRQCQTYQDEYLNSVSLMRDAALAQGSLASLEISSDGLEQIFQRKADQLGPMLIKINDECGEHVASTTQRKASELLR